MNTTQHFLFYLSLTNISVHKSVCFSASKPPSVMSFLFVTNTSKAYSDQCPFLVCCVLPLNHFSPPRLSVGLQLPIDFSTQYPILTVHCPPYVDSSTIFREVSFPSFLSMLAVSWVLVPCTATLRKNWGWWTKSKTHVFIVWGHLWIFELISLRKAKFKVQKKIKSL